MSILASWSRSTSQMNRVLSEFRLNQFEDIQVRSLHNIETRGKNRAMGRTQGMWVQVVRVSPKRTERKLSVRNERNQRRAESVTPKDLDNCSRRIAESVMSKAAMKLNS